MFSFHKKGLTSSYSASKRTNAGREKVYLMIQQNENYAISVRVMNDRQSGVSFNTNIPLPMQERGYQKGNKTKDVEHE